MGLSLRDQYITKQHDLSKYLHNQCILYVVLTLRKRLYLNSYSLMQEKVLIRTGIV